MSGVQEVAKIGEGMMMVHLEGVHRLEGVPHLEEALHQEEMAELGGGEMLHQEDPHQDVEVEMMVHQEGVLLLEGILEKEMVVDPGDQAQGMILLVTGVVQEEGEMSGVQEVVKIGEGMMMVHLEGVHRLEGVPHLEEALHQEEMAELGGGEMLHQEDPHQDVEVEMMVH